MFFWEVTYMSSKIWSRKMTLSQSRFFCFCFFLKKRQNSNKHFSSLMSKDVSYHWTNSHYPDYLYFTQWPVTWPRCTKLFHQVVYNFFLYNKLSFLKKSNWKERFLLLQLVCQRKFFALSYKLSKLLVIWKNVKKNHITLV